uniref:Myosin light chain 5 n=2 Tax=Canis lupus dingo TaxID=286419 RepID=A0A8C0LNC9_CANLU
GSANTQAPAPWLRALRPGAPAPGREPPPRPAPGRPQGPQRERASRLGWEPRGERRAPLGERLPCTGRGLPGRSSLAGRGPQQPRSLPLLLLRRDAGGLSFESLHPLSLCAHPVTSCQASRKTKKKEGGGLRAQRASSNVFSNFEQTQIQEFKEAFTLMDQNRDGFIDKEDLKDTYASLGKTNVKDEELDAMLKEASGPINFTMFLNMFGAKLTGTDGEETILNAFKMLDPDGKGSINKDYIKRLLMSQADKMTAEEVDQMFQFATIDAAGNLDYKALSYVLTHGEEKEE